ncbi:MAG: hypothetical protein F6K11_17150 [Leptolyngbya sp. SIO3F4]|nr:hypothetical protein [Leptolyngbya sp. SIO3F4]
MKAWIGKVLIFIAICHSIVGFIVYRSVLDNIFNDGVFNTIAIGENPNRESAFWFLYTGFMLLLIGGFVDYLERLDLDIPLVLIIAFSTLTIIGIAVMPVSGFWLLVPPVLGLMTREMLLKGKSIS